MIRLSMGYLRWWRETMGNVPVIMKVRTSTALAVTIGKRILVIVDFTRKLDK